MSGPRALRVVLLCHDDDPIDAVGLASWLAHEMDLVGIVALREGGGRKLDRLRREIRRSGLLRALDVLAFRLYYRLRLAGRDLRWRAEEVARLQRRYPADLARVPRIEAESPNRPEVERFLRARAPDVAIARCKFILKPDIFEIPRAGTYVLHPGICPEYRNAHGCFWALARRDLGRVGMTLLRVDRGIDTGPVFLHATVPFDERRESHVVIQTRVVTENLDSIGAAIREAASGTRPRVPTEGRPSALWGQPRLTDYARWKRSARRGEAS